MLRDPIWRDSICFSQHETNKCAHLLAQCGFASSFSTTIVEHDAPIVHSMLMYDDGDFSS